MTTRRGVGMAEVICQDLPNRSELLSNDGQAVGREACKIKPELTLYALSASHSQRMFC